MRTAGTDCPHTSTLDDPNNRRWLAFYPPDVPGSLSYPDIGLADLLRRAAKRHPDRIACTLFDEETSYRELWRQSEWMAAALRQMGAGPGARVGLLLPNLPEYIVALNGTWLTGATALQLSPLSVAEENQRLIDLTDCQIVVTLDLLAPTIMKSLDDGPLEHVVVVSLEPRLSRLKSWLYRAERVRRRGPFRLRDGDRFHRMDRLLRHRRGPVPRVPIVPAEDIAVLIPTGGTTATPKIVMLSHRNLVANALQVSAWARAGEREDSILGVLPFFHSYGLTVGMLTAATLSATLHLHPRFETRPVLDLIERRRPTLMPAVPAMLAALNRAMKKRPTDLSSIRAVICGASALDPGVRSEFEAAGAQYIAEGYGLSEASPVTHANPIGMNNRPGTIGVPLPDTLARIVDPVTGDRDVPIGEVGELIVRGPQVMAGYLNDRSQTEETIRDGWLYTGDMARQDADGYFTIVDRKKDIIKASGFLVYPAEVEEVLRRFPGVAEAAVIGVPDPEKGEIIKALIVPRNGSINIASLQKFCRQHLGKHKRPRQFEIVRQLPKNFLGKVLRRQLRETATAQ